HGRPQDSDAVRLRRTVVRHDPPRDQDDCQRYFRVALARSHVTNYERRTIYCFGEDDWCNVSRVSPALWPARPPSPRLFIALLGLGKSSRGVREWAEAHAPF